MSYSREYQEKLKHPLWQKRRLEVLQAADWKCRCCGDHETELHVHHLIYSSGEPWEAPAGTLEVLCADCHEWRRVFNDFWGRSPVPTGFCQYFISFFKDSFDGTNDCAMNCESVNYLHKRIVILRGANDAKVLPPSPPATASPAPADTSAATANS